jgi:formamidopyrimidine-DNA glycosylase
VPELPEVEALVRRLSPRLLGQTVLSLDVHRPLVLRNLLPAPQTEAVVVGRRVTSLERQGKFFVIGLDGLWLATHFMLAGNLTWPQSADAVKARDYYTLTLSPGVAMRYNDPRGMGKTYLTADLDSAPGLAGMALDALSAGFTREVFLQRLKGCPGEIKGVLTRERVTSGIGNAYADEILFSAGIYPFQKSSRLSAEQRDRLYSAIRQVLQDRLEYLVAHWPPEMDLHWREGLLVHRRGGEPCARCGTPISEVNVARRPTNFCRNCQPGLLISN